jgi:hypothetical protein
VDLHFGFGWTPAMRILWTVVLVTPVWLITTFLTEPVDAEHLDVFYRRVRPNKALWGPVAARCSDVPVDSNIGRTLLGWILAALGIYSLMFAIGKLVLQEFQQAAISAFLTTVIGYLLWRANFRNKNPLLG